MRWWFAMTFKMRLRCGQPLARYVGLAGRGSDLKESNSDSGLQWRDDAERYIPSAPVILAGLKADLRPSFPTLKLAHLNEPDATSIGQVCFGPPSPASTLDNTY